ncbi:CBS domain-containing protein [Inhella gelatinilytica]|uniref:CBS domain-containing protein n=1 Tax=Inhella gelatinilytica TaxID=2795030 RepID=A0A931ITW8_9BURK|nr:CBS domain-containing protein [Inhella gelatinilytica]MBH9551877.1 CBS domain-containing protein [Inhella gelatinilytica]
MSRTLKDLSSGIVMSAVPETSASQAAQLMRQQHVGSLVVVDPASPDGRALGVLTDRDLVLAVLAEELDPKVMTVGDLMSTEVVSLPQACGLLDAIAAMRAHKLRRVLVEDDAGRVVGVVSLEDVIEGLASELTQLALALRESRDRERALRQ